ncbi:MAG: hypothetical protein N2578_04415 [Bdellovibrionaceae bacterium]|nr:hypothetical protein [Pseudobdellovibrionaceae bacterium]
MDFMVLSWVLVFLLTFLGMEFVAWGLHKYVMHGFLWVLHEDHHDPNHKGIFQKNDAFAFFFFLPSFLSILFGTQGDMPLLGAFGFGIMAYGLAYFFVHEIIIHRRLRWFKSMNFYFDGLVAAHKGHHSVHTKEGAYNFGMLVVHPRYITQAWKRRRARSNS